MTEQAFIQYIGTYPKDANGNFVVTSNQASDIFKYAAENDTSLTVDEKNQMLNYANKLANEEITAFWNAEPIVGLKAPDGTIVQKTAQEWDKYYTEKLGNNWKNDVVYGYKSDGTHYVWTDDLSKTSVGGKGLAFAARGVLNSLKALSEDFEGNDLEYGIARMDLIVVEIPVITPTPTPVVVTPTPPIITPSVVPSIVTPTPTSTPTPIIITPTPTLTPTSTPIPTPTLTPEVPPKSNRYAVTEGYASENSYYLANVKIDNDLFKVFQGFNSNGNPIPTNEDLKLTGCTTLVGAVKNLGKNTVTFTPWVYTVNAEWSRVIEKTGWRQAKINGVLQYDEDDNPIMEEYTYEETIGGVVSADTPLISGTTTYYKIRSNTNWGTTRKVIVTNDAFGSYEFEAPRSINYYPTMISDATRITENGVLLSGFEYPEDAQSAAEIYAANATWDDFWNVETDILNSDIGVINYNGAVSDNACNILKDGDLKTLEVKNKSVNDAYVSTGLHEIEWKRFNGRETGWSFKPNNIRIHTPIYNEIVITSPYNNQLVDEKMANGNKIVTLDEEFTVKVNLDGSSVYYSEITNDLKKYVKCVYIDCGVCGKRINGYEHKCIVPVTCDDNKIYPIKATVIAKNIWPGGKSEESKINDPDEIYILEQHDSIYVAGKIYDLEVRTTDDPGWVVKNAEKLSSLVLGEAGDNRISAYKYGIKLGYRAYFDLKTLRNSKR